MIPYIIRRLLQLVIVLIGVTLITFTILRLVPGDPGESLYTERSVAEMIRGAAPITL